MAMPNQGLQSKNGHARIEQERCTGVTELMRRDMEIHLFTKRSQAGLTVTTAQGFVVVVVAYGGSTAQE